MNKFILLLNLSILASCTSLPICESSKGLQNIPDTQMRYYSAEDDLWYDFSNDQNNIIITIATTNKTLQERILQNGVKFYFSEKNGKSETRFLQYPMPIISSKIEPNYRNLSPENKVDLQLKTIKKNALWVDGKINRQIALNDSSKTKITINPTTMGGLQYTLQIPTDVIRIDKRHIVLGITIDALHKDLATKHHPNKDLETNPDGTAKSPMNGGMGNMSNQSMMGGTNRNNRGHYRQPQNETPKIKGVEKTMIWTKVILE